MEENPSLPFNPNSDEQVAQWFAQQDARKDATPYRPRIVNDSHCLEGLRFSP